MLGRRGAVISVPAGAGKMWSGSWAALPRPAGVWRLCLWAGAGWLVVSVIVLLISQIVLRLTLVPAVVEDVLVALVAVALAALAAGALQLRRLAAGTDSGRSVAEADRMRTALLAAVSHDLRSPLAAGKAAVSCLRSSDIELTAADRDELLATADESLDLLTRLAGSLLDVSRLQAGARSVFPRPADLEEITICSLAGLGPQAQAVTISIPPDLPEVMADPPIMERVIANVTANALRYSPAGSPPQLTACHRGGRVELRVVDRGPGVPEADRDRMFVPFQRLGDTDSSTGVGLGLAVSRGLIEAMRGALEAEETPGGGLTMAISVPAAPRPPRAEVTRSLAGEPRRREREEITSAAAPNRSPRSRARHAAMTVSRSPANSAEAGV